MPSLAALAGDAGIPKVAQSAAAGVAAPSAAAAVATLAQANLPSGLYRAHVWTKCTGSTDEPKDHNMELRAGSTVLAGALLSTLQRGGYRSVGRPFQLDGSTDVTVNATANATASTVYHATVLLERLA